MQHYPIFGDNIGIGSFTLTRCVLVAASDLTQFTGSGGDITFKSCTIVATFNQVTTATAAVSSGTTLTVVDAVNVRVPGGSTPFGDFIIHPNVSVGTNIASISGTGPYVLTLQGGSITGPVNIGDTVLLQSINAHFPTGPVAATNTCFFGGTTPVANAYGGGTFTSCVTDSNQVGSAGLTIASFAPSFNTASGQGNAATIDVRVPDGSPLIGAGTADSSVPYDIFGNPYSPTARTVGAVQAAGGFPMMTSG